MEIHEDESVKAEADELRKKSEEEHEKVINLHGCICCGNVRGGNVICDNL